MPRIGWLSCILVLAALFSCSCGVHDEVSDTTTGSTQQFYTLLVDGPLVISDAVSAEISSAAQGLMDQRKFSLGLGRVQTDTRVKSDSYKLHSGEMTSWQWDIDPDLGYHPYEWPRINDSIGSGSLDGGSFRFSQDFAAPFGDMQNLHLEASFNSTELQRLIYVLRGMAKYYNGVEQMTAQFKLSWTQDGQPMHVDFEAPCSVYFHELHNNI